MILSKVHDFPASMTSAEMWLLHGAILGYLIAAILALLGLFWPRRFGLSSTHVVAGIASFAFTIYFCLRFAHDGVVPLANVFEVLLLVGYGIAIGYFLVMLKRRVHTLAAWVFPMVAVILFMALPLADSLGPSSVDRPLNNPLLIAHIILAMVATTQFAFAAVVSIVYLLQDRTLRRKRDSIVLRSLPPLETLEGMVFAAVRLGLLIMTTSLVLAFAVVWDNISVWISSPVVVSGVLMWVVFLLAALGRSTQAIRGRREMYLVLAGFALVALVYFTLSVTTGRP